MAISSLQSQFVKRGGGTRIVGVARLYTLGLEHKHDSIIVELTMCFETETFKARR